MLIIDDLLLMILGNIEDYANRQHLEYLKDYLKRVTLMYERGLLTKEAFEEQKGKVLKSIEAHSLHLEDKRGPVKRIELGV